MVPDDHIEFLHVFWTRRPTFTYIFFGLNILIFFLMALAGGSMGETLMAFGVKDNAAIGHGQWWRFVTPIFIHIGLLHLFFNSYALWIVGPQVEKLYGPARFVIMYLMTGIAGVYGSYYYHPATLSAGASGAIFGLFGVLLVFGIRYRDSIPPSFKRAVGTGVLPVIVINLVIGFSLGAFIDNAAHISGLLMGVALAAIIPFQKPGTETPSIFTTLQMALLATVVVCFYMVGKNYDGPHFSVTNLTRGLFQIIPSGGSATNEFIDAINNAQKTFEETSKELESGQTTHLPTLKANTAKSIDQLRKAPSLAKSADALTADLLRVMQDQYELIEDIERAGTVTLANDRRLQENVRAYDKVMADFSSWVDSEGHRYGIQNDK
jgi:rhomboid protease GluP